MGVVAGVVGGWWEGRSGGCWLVAVKGQRRVQSGAVVKCMCITREANMRQHSGKRRQNLARHYVILARAFSAPFLPSLTCLMRQDFSDNLVFQG